MNIDVVPLVQDPVIVVFIFKKSPLLLPNSYPTVQIRSSKKTPRCKNFCILCCIALLSGSSKEDEGPNEEEFSYPGWREEEERRMEERKTKALSMLSKLQDDRPRRQANGNKGRSNFEDCKFIHSRTKCW